jgi:hypothetical protein
MRVLASLLWLPAAAALAYTVPAGGPSVKWTGRAVPTAGGVAFDWLGVSASVTLNNSFSVLTARVIDHSGAGNKLNVYLVGEGISAAMPPVATLYTQPGDATYTLFSARGRASFTGAAATLRLEKAVEARFTQGNVTLVSFASDAPFLPPPPPSARRLEVIGDSITSSDLVYCVDRLGGHQAQPNSLWADDASVAYHALLCAHFGADCSVVSWGGMGLVWNDVPVWTWPVLPDVYGSALGWEVSAAGPGAPLAHPWNFSAAPAPSGVIINLGTNDARALNNATNLARWSAAMAAFVQRIAAAYAPTPHFFLAWGPMSTAYLEPLLAASAELAARGLPVSLLNMTLDKALDCGHPSAADHRLMALKVLPNISAALGWG